MKMTNTDLKKITAVKQYLLDPPVSFKLYDYAITYMQDAIETLSNYTAAKDVSAYLESILQNLQNKTIPKEELRSTLKDAGLKVNRLTNR